MKMKKIVSILLAVLTFGGFAGCFNINKPSSGDDGDIIIPQLQEEVIEYTEHKLVDNGTSAYKIVLEDDATYDEELAAWEIEELFAESTSITLTTMYESEVTYSANAKLIILGDTKYTQNAGVDVSAIPRDGFVVKTVDTNLFILGENAGVAYGAYEFLEKALGYEYFVDGVYALNKNVKNSYLPKLNISDSPDFAFRADAWGKDGTRARIRAFNEAFMSRDMYHIHNTFEWLPKSSYEYSNPDWYADDGSQLCYTAHGNATELALMQDTVLAKFKDQVNYYFGQGDYRQAISFTQQDSSTGAWCNCSACTQDKQTYGAESSSLIRFLNPIAKKFKAWMKETWPGHEVKIVFFAYQDSENAPVKESNGKYVPMDASLVLEDNLAVWVAPIRGDYIRSVYDVKNMNMYQLFQKWSALTKNFYVWGYDTDFKNYLMWYDSFNALQDFYRYIHQFGAVYVFNQGQIYSGSNLTGFDALKAALNYQLMWDVNLDVKRFTDRFFEVWFGAAAEDMRTYYESYRSWSEYIKSELDYSGNIMFEGFTTAHYPLQVLNAWMNNIEDAYKSIESLKTTNATLYKNLYNRITAESMVIRFALINLYGTSYKPEILLSMKLSFKEDATKLNFSRLAENAEISTLYEAWGI